MLIIAAAGCPKRCCDSPFVEVLLCGGSALTRRLEFAEGSTSPAIAQQTAMRREQNVEQNPSPADYPSPMKRFGVFEEHRARRSHDGANLRAEASVGLLVGHLRMHRITKPSAPMSASGDLVGSRVGIHVGEVDEEVERMPAPKVEMKPALRADPIGPVDSRLENDQGALQQFRFTAEVLAQNSEDGRIVHERLYIGIAVMEVRVGAYWQGVDDAADA